LRVASVTEQGFVDSAYSPRSRLPDPFNFELVDIQGADAETVREAETASKSTASQASRAVASLMDVSVQMQTASQPPPKPVTVNLSLTDFTVRLSLDPTDHNRLVLSEATGGGVIGAWDLQEICGMTVNGQADVTARDLAGTPPTAWAFAGSVSSAIPNLLYAA
jgi:hypothetical protein